MTPTPASIAPHQSRSAASTTARYDHRTQFILNLLASNTPQALAQAAQLVPITKCPPAIDRHLSSRDILDRVWNRDNPTAYEKQVAVEVHPRPHPRTSPVTGKSWTCQAHPRLDEIKVGRTVTQMLARGVLRSDIDAAVRAGWLVLTSA